MRPYIFQFEFSALTVELASYQVFAVLGLLLAGFLYLRLAWRGFEYITAHLLQVAGLMLASFIGARIAQSVIVIVTNQITGADFFEVFGTAGATVTGGLLFGIGMLGLFVVFDPFRIMNFRTLDAIAMAVPAGHAVGRVGCLFAGCCYGKLVSPDNPIGITYSDAWIFGQQAGGSLVHGPRWPSPLMEAAGLALLSAVLILLRKRRRPGTAMAYYLVGYGILRFFIEFSRADTARGIFAGLPTGQWYSFISVAAGVALYLLLRLAPRFRGADADSGFFGRKLRSRDIFESVEDTS